MIKKLLPFAFFSSIFIPIVNAGESSSNACYDLWYDRNFIFAHNGYCFESNLGQEVFKNFECSTNKPAFSSNDKNKINQIGVDTRNGI